MASSSRCGPWPHTGRRTRAAAASRKRSALFGWTNRMDAPPCRSLGGSGPPLLRIRAGRAMPARERAAQSAAGRSAEPAPLFGDAFASRPLPIYRLFFARSRPFPRPSPLRFTARFAAQTSEPPRGRRRSAADRRRCSLCRIPLRQGTGRPVRPAHAAGRR